MSICQNYINGRWTNSRDGRTYPQKNPADLEEITGHWPLSTPDDVNDAVEAARKAFKTWSCLTVYKRGEYLKEALRLMQDRVDRIAQVITAENGKTLVESRAEISSTIKEMEFQINEGLRLGGEIMPSEQKGVMAYSVRRPLGPVAIISPWNFPFNVPCRKVTPALMAGNTCILKPSILTPGTAAEFVKLYDEAELPPGVLNVIMGSGSILGDRLVAHPAVKAVSFTGSTEVGMAIHKKAADHLVRSQLEMGGKNPIVVLADADLKAAAASAVLAAYACAGQWCTATSRAIVEKAVLRDFLDLIRERVKSIVVGKGTSSQTTMGPVCGDTQLKNILAGIERGRAEGAKLFFGGRRIIEGDLQQGCFVEPTVFTEVKPSMFIAQEEIFGPVLSVLAVDDFDQAIEVANEVRFGLSSSVYTRDIEKAFTFAEKTDVGLTHVNLPTSFKEPQLAFGGVKNSGQGIPEAGHSGIEFFSEHKVVYIKYR